MSNETDNVSFVSALTYNELADIRIRARGDLRFDKKQAHLSLHQTLNKDMIELPSKGMVGFPCKVRYVMLKFTEYLQTWKLIFTFFLLGL